MNVTELARKLRVPSKELLEILPEVGFDIGRRAIKIDNRQAQRIIEQWPRLIAEYRAKNQPVEDTTAPAEALDPKDRIITLPQYIAVKDFAQKLQISLPRVMTELMKNGILSSMNEKIDFDTASIIGQELGYEIVADESAADEVQAAKGKRLEDVLASQDKTKMISRPPVVVVMGHVDHGKTKLLDTIRETNIIDKESGGITQHMGAYQVEKRGQLITFIDTPGHEAFTTMRSRGARVADVAILVIAADDSIQPQTKESIKIIKSADIPMVVAINKIDKPEANIEKVKQDLGALNLIPEDWGGKTICVPISAKAGTGIEDLLEMILLVAETEQANIVANPTSTAVGTVVESHVDKGEGTVATMLVQNGTLRRGDEVAVGGTYYGKVKAMKDFLGRDVETAPPSMPVKILGLKVAPSVGDILEAVTDGSVNRKINKYQMKQLAVDYVKPKESHKEGEGGVKTLNLVIKADVLGSLEAIISSLTSIDSSEVAVNIISKGLGTITENDIERADSAKAILIGFHVKIPANIEHAAKEKKIEIKQYDIIYKLIEDIRDILEKMLAPDVIRTDLGKLNVLALFNKEKDATVFGGVVTEGEVSMKDKVEVVRFNQVFGTGEVVQLQSNKVDVNSVVRGQQCGIKVKHSGKFSVEIDDVINVYREQIKEKKLG
jgi:translation initiation factor IF-2